MKGADMPKREYGEFAPVAADWSPEVSAPTRARPAVMRSISLLAFDPGGTTGWSLMELPLKYNGDIIFHAPFQKIIAIGSKSWHHGQINCSDENAAFWQIGRLLNKAKDAAVITERFILAAQRSEKSDTLLAPVRLNSLIEHHLWRQGRPLFSQTTGVVKPAFRDDRMKHFKVYTSEGGLEHARDADKHLLYFIKRCLGKERKAQVLRELAWPYHFGSNK